MIETRQGEQSTADADAATIVVTDGSDATPAIRTERSPSISEASTEPSDRYVVLQTIGHGGMGTVLRAYDHRLRREVALKRLRADVLDDAAEARLVREAQAMAQLSHPNVVAVYDVQRSDRGVELAMELVVGRNLKQWLDQRKRSTAEILRAFVQAGEGLAAAHRAGLIHRDFKPANVLVGEDAQVKVTDFGLAKVATESGSDGPPSLDGAALTESLDSVDSLRTPLTRADTVVGTPRYMAPEQCFAEPLDARTDQYAWCVALWEALVGAPPFGGETNKAVTKAKSKGPPPWPRTAKVPRGVAEAIRRGLAFDRNERWPTMDELLATMGTGPTRGTQQLGVLFGVAGLAAVATWGMQRTAPEDTRCEGAAAQLAGAWDDEHRTAVEQSLRAAGGEAALPEVVEIIDEYADGWVAQHTEACEASTLRGEQSPAVMDLRMACLGRARMQLVASTELLAAADAQVASKALDLARGLPHLPGCEDVERLQARHPGPEDPEVAARVDELRQQIARVIALELAGKWSDALELARRQDEAAVDIGFVPMQAHTGFLVGHLLERLGKYEDSISAMRQTLALALQADDDALAAKSAGVLTFLLSDAVGRPDEARWMATVALGMANRDPSNHSAVGVAHGNLATVLYHQGKYEESVLHRHEALAAFEATDQHHEVALAHSNLGGTLASMGKYDEALVELERAKQTYAASVGLDHPDVGHVYATLGGVYEAQQRLDEAVVSLRRAAELFEKGQGPRSPQASMMRSNIGELLRQQGKLDEAEAAIRSAMEALEMDGEPNVRVAGAKTQLGRVLADQGHHEQAEAMLTEALAMHEEIGGAEQDDTAKLETWLAETLTARELHDQAREHLERAWTIAQQVELPPTQRASIAYALARAVDRAGQRIRAHELSEQALELLPADASADELRAEIEAWLANPNPVPNPVPN